MRKLLFLLRSFPTKIEASDGSVTVRDLKCRCKVVERAGYKDLKGVKFSAESLCLVLFVSTVLL